MMRFLTPILRGLFKPKQPMELQQHDPDPIGAALGAAVDEHLRVNDAEASEYRQRISDTMSAIDDLLHRMEKRHG